MTPAEYRFFIRSEMQDRLLLARLHPDLLPRFREVFPCYHTTASTWGQFWSRHVTPPTGVPT